MLGGAAPPLPKTARKGRAVPAAPWDPAPSASARQMGAAQPPAGAATSLGQRCTAAQEQRQRVSLLLAAQQHAHMKQQGPHTAATEDGEAGLVIKAEDSDETPEPRDPGYTPDGRKQCQWCHVYGKKALLQGGGGGESTRLAAACGDFRDGSIESVAVCVAHSLQETYNGDQQLGRNEVWDPTDWSNDDRTCFKCFVLQEAHPTVPHDKLHVMETRGGKNAVTLLRERQKIASEGWNRYTSPGHKVEDTTYMVQRCRRRLNIYSEEEFQEKCGCTLADAGLKADYWVEKNEDGHGEFVCALRPRGSRFVDIEACTVLSCSRNRMPYELTKNQAQEVFEHLLESRIGKRSFDVNHFNRWPNEDFVRSQCQRVVAARRTREAVGSAAGAPVFESRNGAGDDDNEDFDLEPELTSALLDTDAGPRDPKSPPSASQAASHKGSHEGQQEPFFAAARPFLAAAPVAEALPNPLSPPPASLETAETPTPRTAGKQNLLSGPDRDSLTRAGISQPGHAAGAGALTCDAGSRPCGSPGSSPGGQTAPLSCVTILPDGQRAIWNFEEILAGNVPETAISMARLCGVLDECCRQSRVERRCVLRVVVTVCLMLFVRPTVSSTSSGPPAMCTGNGS